MTWRVVLAVMSCLALATPVAAHEVRPAYLELVQESEETFGVLWKVPSTGGSRRVELFLRLPEACEVVAEPHGVLARGAYVERSRVRHPEAFVGATIHVDGLEATLTDVLVRVERLDGSTQIGRLTPTSASLVVEAAPSMTQLAWTYFVLGVEHILLGIDHLLFVLALLLLVKGWKRVVGTITAFTVAHSITLGLATLGVVHVPGPPVEAIIALSIVFVAAEILHARRGQPGLSARSPWIVAFTFGLLHGLGFAGALSEVGLPQNAIPLSLLFFNVGVEAGQLLFIGAVAIIAAAAMPLARRVPEPVAVVPPYAIGCVAMFWVIERVLSF